MEILSRRITDGRVLSLIHKYMRAGVVVSHKFLEIEQRVPQGDSLGSLLSNIMLNELDKELEKRGHPFVSYVDDRTQKSITQFIESKLYLRVNRDKTTMGYVEVRRFWVTPFM